MGSARCRQDVGSHSHLLLIADGGFIKPNPVMATFGAALLGLKDHRSAGCNCDHPPPQRPSSTDGTENVHLLTWGPLSWKTGLIPIRGYDCPILSGNTAAHKAHRLVFRSSLNLLQHWTLGISVVQKGVGLLKPRKVLLLGWKTLQYQQLWQRKKKSVHIIFHFFLYDTNDIFFWWSIEIPTLTYGHRCVQWPQWQGFRYKQLNGTLRSLEIGRGALSPGRSLGQPLLLHIKKSQLRWLGHLFALSVQGMCYQEEAKRKTQDLLGELYLSAGLGTPRDLPSRAGGWKREREVRQLQYPGDPATEKAEKTDRLLVSNARFFSNLMMD